MPVSNKNGYTLPFLVAAFTLLPVITAAPGAPASRDFYEYAGEWRAGGPGKPWTGLPKDIAVAPNGNVYVTVNGDGYVQCFTGEGKYVGRRDAASVRKKWRWFENPGPIAIGPDGTVYVIASSDFKVDCFTLTGSFIRGWKRPVDWGLEWWDIAVASNGEVYVNQISPATDAVLRFTAEGALIGKREILTGWTGPRYAGSIAVAPNGNVFVTDIINDRVYRFSRNLRLIAVWGRAGGPSVLFNEPYAVAVGPDNTVFVGDSLGADGPSRIRAFTIEGQMLGQAPLGRRKDREHPVYISTLAFGPDGTLYAVAPGSRTIFYFRPGGKK